MKGPIREEEEQEGGSGRAQSGKRVGLDGGPLKEDLDGGPLNVIRIWRRSPGGLDGITGEGVVWSRLIYTTNSYKSVMDFVYKEKFKVKYKKFFFNIS